MRNVKINWNELSILNRITSALAVLTGGSTTFDIPTLASDTCSEDDEDTNVIKFVECLLRPEDTKVYPALNG